MPSILIRGARTHNLRNIDLELPRDRLIVFTGLSGSGKSSLAFDTIYAEGQRRYVESLSAYARQFLSMMEKPDVDSIEGLSPAIAIEQKSTSHNPRSTVGTVTEIYDHLRLLFARVGIPRCPDHGVDLLAQTVSQMVDQVLRLPEGTPILLLAPLIDARKGEHAHVIEQLRGQGFVRARIDGIVVGAGNAAEARPEEEAHDRGRGGPPEGARGRGPAPGGVVRDGAATGGRRGARRRSWTMPKTSPSWCSPTSSPARSAATVLRSSSRGCSRSTTRRARARRARAWACSSSSIPRASCTTATCRSPAVRSAAGTAATRTTSRWCNRWRGTTSSTSKSRGRNWRRSTRRSCCTGAATRRSTSATSTRAAAPCGAPTSGKA